MKGPLKPGRIVMPALSGILLTLSQPPLSWSLLAWIGMVPFILSLQGSSRKTALIQGITFGLFYFMGTQYWIYHSLYRYGNIPFLLSLVLVLFLCLYESIYTGLFSLIIPLALKRRIPLVLAAPVLWSALEYLRGKALTGFPWSLLGYSQYQTLPVIQIADITGIYGVSFLIVTVNSAVVSLFLKTSKERRAITRYLPLTLSLTLLVSVIVYGHNRIAEFSHTSPSKRVRLSLIQGNIEQDAKLDPAYQEDVINTYRDLTIGALEKKPDMVIWPETALPFYLNGNPEREKELLSFVQEISVPLLTGAMLIKDTPDKRSFAVTNSAVLIDRHGKMAYRYDKIHLVPFGEYIPLKKFLFFIDKLVSVVGEFQPGREYIQARTKWGSFPVLICYEIIFPDQVRNFLKEGGELIFNITNDAWFGRTTGPYQHFAMAALRAVENRRTLVRVANSGITGVVGPTGEILAETALFERTAVTVKADIYGKASFYTRYGDLFSFANLAFSVLLTAIITLTRRRINIC